MERNQVRGISGVLLCTILILILALAHSNQVFGLSRISRIIEFAIATSEATDSIPDVDGNIVVWMSGVGEPYYDIYGYDLLNSELFIVSDKSTQESAPKISGNWVVWIEDEQGEASPNIVTKNIQSDEERTIVRDNKWSIGSIAIDHDYIVWPDGLCGLWLYDIQTQVAISITDTGYNDEPAIDWPWVVWRHQDIGAWIWAYNITTTQILTLTEGADANAPDVCDDIAVWSESSPLPLGGRNIYGQDLNTSKRFTITHNSEFNNRPRIDSNIVVWSTYGSGTNDSVYAYDMASGEVISVTSLATVDQVPSISGNVVVWSRFDDWPNDWNIYGARLYSDVAFLPLVLE